MCIAIYNKKGLLKKKTLQTCHENNPDGMGYAVFGQNNRLIVGKRLKGFDRFYKDYKDLRKKYPKEPFIIHFRRATHGEVTLENCHPFKVKKNLVFCHNGMLRDFGSRAQDKSDTKEFGEEILSKFDWDFSPKEKILLSHLIKDNNKLIIMKPKTDAMIINEEKGLWVQDNWFSNASFMPRIEEEKEEDPKTDAGEENSWCSHRLKTKDCSICGDTKKKEIEGGKKGGNEIKEAKERGGDSIKEGTGDKKEKTYPVQVLLQKGEYLVHGSDMAEEQMDISWEYALAQSNCKTYKEVKEKDLEEEFHMDLYIDLLDTGFSAKTAPWVIFDLIEDATHEEELGVEEEAESAAGSNPFTGWKGLP